MLERELVCLEVYLGAALRGAKGDRPLARLCPHPRSHERIAGAHDCVGQGSSIERGNDVSGDAVLDELGYRADIRRDHGPVHHHRLFDGSRYALRARHGREHEDVASGKRRTNIVDGAYEHSVAADDEPQLSAQRVELAPVGGVRLVCRADHQRLRLVSLAAEEGDRTEEVLVPLLRVEVADRDEDEVIGNEAEQGAGCASVDALEPECLGVDRGKEGTKSLSERVGAWMDVPDGAAGAHDDVRQPEDERHHQPAHRHRCARVEKLPDDGLAFELCRDRSMRIHEPAELNDVYRTLANQPADRLYLAREVGDQAEQRAWAEGGADAMKRRQDDLDARPAKTACGVASTTFSASGSARFG